MNYSSSIKEIEKLFETKNGRPYLFRTRLERLIIRLRVQAKHDENILDICNKIYDKLQCISDKSNQTPEGTLKSFVYIEEDLIKLNQSIQSI